MNEKEKVVWKVEILKNAEDMDDLIDQRIREIQAERNKINDVVQDSKNLVNAYEAAVDRIGYKYKRSAAEQSKYEELINSANQQKRKTMPMVENTDLDESQMTIGGVKPKTKVGLLQFKKNLAFG